MTRWLAHLSAATGEVAGWERIGEPSVVLSSFVIWNATVNKHFFYYSSKSGFVVLDLLIPTTQDSRDENLSVCGISNTTIMKCLFFHLDQTFLFLICSFLLPKTQEESI